MRRSDLHLLVGRFQLDRVFQLNHASTAVSSKGALRHTGRDPLDAAAMVRLALETVQGDMRSIYGRSGRGTGRVNTRGERLAEITALNRRCFFRPSGLGRSVQFRQTWDLIQIFMLFYVALVVPFRIGFHADAQPSEWLFWLEVVVDLYFWLDILINFRTGYYDENDELVVDQKRVCRYYLYGWFAMDFVSCLPVTYIGLLVNTAGTGKTGTELKLLRVFRMMRLTKLLRLTRIKRLVARLEHKYRFFAKGGRVAAIVGTIMFTAHLVACIWHLAGSSTVQDVGTDRSTGEVVRLKPWVKEMYGGIGDGSTEHPDFENGLQVSTMTRYVDALYYSVTTLTTVGYGDRVPSTNVEKVISILCELAGSVIFGIIAGSLSTIALSESMTRVEVKQKIGQLEELMQQKNVPMKMRAEFASQMVNWFEKKSVFDEEVLLSYLPPRQRRDLLTLIYKPFMTQSPLLQGLEWPVVSRMCLMMRPYLAVVDDVIFAEGDVGEEMYMVVRGAIKLHSSIYPAYNTRMWEDGAFFGELPLLDCGGGNGRMHVYTAKAVVDTDCSYITLEDYEELNVQRPTLRATMREHARQRALRFGTESAAVRLRDSISNSPSTSRATSPKKMDIPEADSQTTTEPESTEPDDWFLIAKQSAPHLLESEIRDLRAVFWRYASASDNQSQRQLSIEAIQSLLDDSLKEMYEQLDDDRSGALERQEIKHLLQLLGMPTTDAEMDSCMSDLDGDNSGEVEFEEFKAWWEKSQFVTEENQKRELQDLFDAVDTDRSGAIEWEEFLHLVSSHVLRDLELGHAFSNLKNAATGLHEEVEREPRNAADMVRVALNNVRNDTRAIYGTAIRPHKLQLQLEQELLGKKKRCFFRPLGTGAAVQFRQSWDVAQVFIIIYVALSVPFRIGFSREAVPFSAVFWWEVAVDVYFWFDIVLNFRTGYYDRHGQLVIDQKQIAIKYVTGWFPIDVVSCLPVMYVEMLIYGADGQAGPDLIALKTFRLLRMAKLLRLVRMKALLVRLEQRYKALAQCERVLKICFFILLSAHFVACIWYFVGDGENQRLGKNAAGEDVTLSPWVRQLYGNIEEGVCVESGLQIESTECDMHSKYSVSIVTKYLDALYYSVTTLTTVGYGDLVPNTNNEKIVSILCELAGSVTFGIIAGSLSAIAMSETLTKREIKSRSAKLDEFMRTKNVPRAMRDELGTQLSNYFEKKSALDEKQVIACLPPKQQKDLVMAIYRPFVVDCPLLQGLERGLTSRFCLAMRPYFALAGDEIVVEGEIGEEMYLITRGNIKLQSTRYPAYNSRQWEDGAFFGELPLLDCGAEETDTAVVPSNFKLRRKPRRVLHVYTAKALIDSQCTYVTGVDLDELNQKRPELKQTMRKFALQRAERFGVDMGDMADHSKQNVRTQISGATGIMELAGTARSLILEATEESDLKNASGDTNTLLAKLSAVDLHLQHIHEFAERIVRQKARAREEGLAPSSSNGVALD